jgi:hypothetical protein
MEVRAADECLELSMSPHMLRSSLEVTTSMRYTGLEIKVPPAAQNETSQFEKDASSIDVMPEASRLGAIIFSNVFDRHPDR